MDKKISLNLFSENLVTVNKDLGIVKENVDGKTHYFIEGIFAQADIINRNRRLYPRDILFPDIERYNRDFVEKRLAWGELDHPEKRVSVEQKSVSHRITELKFNRSNVIGKAIITNTPMGEIVKGLIDSGGQPAVSTRGLGKADYNPDKDCEVMEIYHMTAIDIVSFPSGLDCFPNGVMEGVDFLVESNLLSKSNALNIIKAEKRISVLEFSRVINSILKGK